jgi:hypothetical protein
MAILEYFLLALLGSTPSTPAPEAPATASLVTLGEEVIVQPIAGVPDAGFGQKKPVKHSSRIWIKKNGQRSSHHRSGHKRGSHVKPDALVVKQKVTQY